jgi:hypothetical protein
MQNKKKNTVSVDSEEMGDMFLNRHFALVNLESGNFFVI